MLPSSRYCIVGVRADGSTKVLCGELLDRELAERVASGLGYRDLFIRIVVEPDDGGPSTADHSEHSGNFR